MLMALVSCVFSSALAGAPKAAPRVPVPNVLIQAHVGQGHKIAGATVTVRDHSGGIVATGRTSGVGTAKLVARGRPSTRAPFTVSVTGGRFAGKAFDGTLVTMLSSNSGHHWAIIDYATTAAAKMGGSQSGGFKRNLVHVMRALGFETRGMFGFRDNLVLRYETRKVGSAQLLRVAQRAGGWDAFTTQLAQTASGHRRVRGLRTAVVHSPHPQYNRDYRFRNLPRCTAPARRSPKTWRCVRPTRPAKTKRKSEMQSTTSGQAFNPGTGKMGTSTVAGPASAGCSIIPASASSSSATTLEANLASYGLEVFAGLITGANMTNPQGGFPAAVSGLVGFAMTETNGALNPSPVSGQLSNIQNNIDCIGYELAQIQNALNDIYVLDEQQQLYDDMGNSTNNCMSSIPQDYSDYLTYVSDAAESPSSATALSSSNPSLSGAGDPPGAIANWQSAITTCGSAIYADLFGAGSDGSSGGGWAQAVSMATGNLIAPGVGDDSVGLSPGTVEWLQQFLNYWQTVTYEQVTLQQEVWNYDNVANGTATVPCPTCQTMYIGLGLYNATYNPTGSATCPAAASQTNFVSFAPGSGGFNYCQAMQDFADVYVNDTYSDELLYYGGGGQTSSNWLGGSGNFAMSAVPMGLGASSSTKPSSVGSAQMVSPQTIANLCLNGTGPNLQSSCSATLSGYSASNALSSYNATPAGSLQAPYEAWFAPQVAKTAALGSGYNFNALTAFFNQQLNATASSTAPGGVALGATGSCSGSSTSCWQLVSADNVYGVNTHYCNAVTTANGCTIGLNQYWAQVTASAAFNTPAPWQNGDGETITVGSGTDVNAAPLAQSVFPQPVPAGAYLLSRPWAQGTDPPAAPVINQAAYLSSGGSTLSITATSGCPSAGCTWSWGPSGPPSGFSSSSLTTVGVLTIPSGVTPPSTLSVVAGNSLTFSAPTTVSVITAPKVLYLGFPGTDLPAGTAWQLYAPNCPVSSCTWAFAPNGTTVPFISGVVNGVANGMPGTFTLTPSGLLTATETLPGSSSPAGTPSDQLMPASEVAVTASGPSGATMFLDPMSPNSGFTTSNGFPAGMTTCPPSSPDEWFTQDSSSCYLVPVSSP